MSNVTVEVSLYLPVTGASEEVACSRGGAY